MLTNYISVDVVYPRKKDTPKGFLEAIVGGAQRQVESKRVEQFVTSGSVEQDLRQALEVRTIFPTSSKLPR